MLAITGDTYDIRDQLKALGCRWDEDLRVWTAPDEGARSQGQALADQQPWLKWRGYMDTLAWAIGNFTTTAWEAGLNACSRGIPMPAAIEEIRGRIVAAGREPEPGWVERNVGRAYEHAEPPKEKVVSGPTWPQVWREEMKWVGSVMSRSAQCSVLSVPRGRKAEYEAHLHSQYWANLFERKMDEQGWCCADCGARKWQDGNFEEIVDETVSLHLHHLTYDRLGAEKMEDVVGLCAECHAKEHENEVIAAKEFFCSRYALRFFGLKQGQEVSDEQLAQIKRLDAHLRQLRERADAGEAPKPAKPEFTPTKLQVFAAGWAQMADTAWLSDRSPVDPVTIGSADFLAALYQPGERVVIFSVFESQGQWVWDSDELAFVPSHVDHEAWGADKFHASGPPLKGGGPFTGSGPNGIWYLCNPVDGEFRQTAEKDKWDRPKWSRRFDQCVRAWRYFVFESDAADPREWIGAMVQLPLPIAAIYTSGGKSIHVLVRVDAGSKAEFDLWRETAKRTMIPLGADPGCMSAVRLTRLPGCWREKDKDGNAWKGGPRLQKLLYLDPEARAEPICARSPVRDVLGGLDAWVRAVVLCDVADVPAGDVERAEAALRWYRSGRANALLAELRRWKG